jgi:hypothetical protein
VSFILLPCSLTLRDPVSPQIGLLGGLWEVISFPFCLLRQVWIRTQVLTSLRDSAPLPSLVPVPHQVPLCIWGLHPDSLGGRVLPLDQAVCWHLVGSKGGTPETREMTNHYLCNPSKGAPKKWCRNLKLRLRQFSRKQCFIVPAQTQQTCVQRLSLENKEVSLYVSLQGGYRSKRQGLTYIWLNVTLLATFLPVLCDLHVSIL